VAQGKSLCTLNGEVSPLQQEDNTDRKEKQRYQDMASPRNPYSFLMDWRINLSTDKSIGKTLNHTVSPWVWTGTEPCSVSDPPNPFQASILQTMSDHVPTQA